MQDNNQLGLNPSSPRKQPWFGPKRFGMGYGPRTWQGYLVTVVMLVPIIIAGTVVGAHSPWFIAAIVVFFAVHLGIIAVQRR
jgi:hypothetical protein